MGAPSFIRELCIALAHRWEPERFFVIFTAYLDESGTHDGSPVTVVAGFMGTARQWEILGRRLRTIQESYGFKIFHATAFKSKSGEFKGWPDQKCLSLTEDLTDLAADNL